MISTQVSFPQITNLLQIYKYWLKIYIGIYRFMIKLHICGKLQILCFNFVYCLIMGKSYGRVSRVL